MEPATEYGPIGGYVVGLLLVLLVGGGILALVGRDFGTGLFSGVDSQTGSGQNGASDEPSEDPAVSSETPDIPPEFLSDKRECP